MGYDKKYVGRRARVMGESGQHLVEFALVLLPLALLLCGICQYGFIYGATMTIRNASDAAARYAVLSTNGTPTVAQVQDYAEQAVAPMLNPALATATVTTNVTVGSTNGATSVQVQYNLPLVIPWVVFGGAVNNSLSLTATTIMR